VLAIAGSHLTPSPLRASSRSIGSQGCCGLRGRSAPGLSVDCYRSLVIGRGDPHPFPSLPLECGLTDSGAQTAATTLSPSPWLTGQPARVHLLSFSCLTGLGFQGFQVGEGDGRVEVGRLKV